MRIRRLNKDQLSNFNVEYVMGTRWEIVKKCIDQDFFDRSFLFLDLGGGNGKFTDRVLENYPNARGTILDNSEFLLSKNKPCERKELVHGSVENMSSLFLYKRFDLIFMNWILHHLVGDSYSKTSENVRTLLRQISQILNHDGKISILENMYDGLLFDDLPGHIIYHLTSSKRMSKLMKKLGANTAGVGVCFRSKKAWVDLIEDADMRVIKYCEDDKWKVRFFYRFLLHMGNIRVGHFWLEKSY